jgi:hypothetical protein
MVALLIAVPVLRVGWLGLRWVRRGDRAYALRALLLVVVVAGAATGSLLA